MSSFIDLFAGMGGMTHGLVQAGWNCLGYAECDTHCSKCKTYTQHLEHETKRFHTVCSICGTAKYQQTHHAHQLIHDPLERKWHKYDVTTITDDDIRLFERERGRVELIAAGFPCQAFSIAGKRKGFADYTRGTLFFEVVRFASILRPKYLLLENVDGLRNHDEGRTLEIIIGTLVEMGYDVEYQVLKLLGVR